ncbi:MULTISPECIES: hypothetical protein [unclassified Mesorhizobium]|uniref:hypothetical protein n=1 Tax=unclassified Mesorhizobium TaxID=325217 RepID=UPI000FCBCD6F|nr:MULTISPECIES: hypothetical protein [unclassified Mesorhizobium]TGU07848.1 hypothetical protein EN806_31380 [bacterium M00.F.Ca.ET.163.01.1.1]TGU47054.1 hypothetical protein EN789_13555 [bacterium M00.F.Ca.ET.146.01.1.1]TGW12718.1 hypothetical protein EN788_08150 [Mesorhizobium sp. M2D.F.Ca.ET.145.01.1.1]TGP33336.1 hypothetical protein EN875_015450 [Mesorhizobium sp. M2D.F.Ca.ET.232.01.1.1]TGP59366.1 hypothetical protein EN869_013890 [Mesorhizobium sp. M2D.F.Ca.ET.226.01.1.1]
MNAHVSTLRPFACPKGMDARTWRQAIEKELNALFDKATALITALDVMEADSEDLEDGADAEPWLGWGERGPRGTVAWQGDKRGSMDDDRELEDEHGGDIIDEPQGDDEREFDPADYDCPGLIEGGQGL